MDRCRKLPARPLVVHDRAYRVAEVPGRSYPIRIIEAAVDTDDRPAIVMIHGMEESWEVWERITQQLEDRHRVVRLDMPWSGALGYDWTTERETVSGWLKCALDAVPGPITALVGHSFGAMATLDYLDLHGIQGLRAAALISPFRLDDDQELDWELIEYLSSRYVRFLELALAIRYRRERLDPDINTLMAEKVRDKIGPVGCIEFLSLLSRSRRIDLQALSIPFMILGGDEDFYSLPSGCSRLAAELPRGEVRILNGCGHFSMIEQPDRVGGILGRFFDEHLRAPSEALDAEEICS